MPLLYLTSLIPFPGTKRAHLTSYRDEPTRLPALSFVVGILGGVLVPGQPAGISIIAHTARYVRLLHHPNQFRKGPNSQKMALIVVLNFFPRPVVRPIVSLHHVTRHSSKIDAPPRVMLGHIPVCPGFSVPSFEDTSLNHIARRKPHLTLIVQQCTVLYTRS